MNRFFKIICFLLVSGTSINIANANPLPAAPQEQNKQDAKFSSDFMEMILYKVRLLDLARTSAHSQELRAFAWQLLPEYLMMGYNIGTFANTNNYVIDPEDNETMKKVDDKVAKFMEKGKTLEWDSDLAETLKDENKDGLDMLEDYKGELKDPKLEEIRMNAITVLQSHNKMIDDWKEKAKKPWKEENRPSRDMKAGQGK